MSVDDRLRDPAVPPQPRVGASTDPNGRSKVRTYEVLGARDKADLDIAWAEGSGSG